MKNVCNYPFANLLEKMWKYNVAVCGKWVKMLSACQQVNEFQFTFAMLAVCLLAQMKGKIDRIQIAPFPNTQFRLYINCILRTFHILHSSFWYRWPFSFPQLKWNRNDVKRVTIEWQGNMHHASCTPLAIPLHVASLFTCCKIVKWLKMIQVFITFLFCSFCPCLHGKGYSFFDVCLCRFQYALNSSNDSNHWDLTRQSTYVFHFIVLAYDSNGPKTISFHSL